MLAIDIAGHVGSVNDQGTGSYGICLSTQLQEIIVLTQAR